MENNKSIQTANSSKSKNTQRRKRCPPRTHWNPKTKLCDKDLYKKNMNTLKKSNIRKMKTKRNSSRSNIPQNVMFNRTRSNNRPYKSPYYYNTKTHKFKNSITKKGLTWKKKHSIHNFLTEFDKSRTKYQYPFICLTMQTHMMLWYHIYKNPSIVCMFSRNFEFNYVIKDKYLYFNVDTESTEFEIAHKNKIINCLKNKKIFVIHLTLTYPNGSHSNYIIINPFRKEIERYEPQIISTYDFEISLMESIKQQFDFLKDYTYVDNLLVCPHEKRSQEYEVNHDMYTTIHEYGRKKTNIERVGMCCMWSFIYVEMRLNFPNLSQDEIIKKYTKYLSTNPNVLHEFINGVTHSFIDALRTNFPEFDIDGMFLNLFKHYTTSNIGDNKVDQLSDEFRRLQLKLNYEIIFKTLQKSWIT